MARTDGSTSGASRCGTAAAAPARAVSLGRSRAGSTRCSFASARTELSSMPATLPPAAVTSPVATAIASSSSSSSGGRFVPDVSR